MVTQLQSTLVSLETLSIGQYQVDYVLDNEYFSTISPSELLGGHVAATARLDLRENDFDLWIEVSGDVSVACDRCLDPVSIPVQAKDMMEVEPEAKSLDLMWLAYELIIVNLPLVHCHPEGECNPQMQALLQAHLCSTIEEPETIDIDN